MRSVVVVVALLPVLVFLSGSSSRQVRDRPKRQLDKSYGSPAYKFCECGRRNVGFDVDGEASSTNARIVGGNATLPNEFPWMALILVGGVELAGSGILINDRYVLTVAHYLDLGQADTKVVLGEHDRCTKDTRTVTFSVERFHPHPEFRAEDNYADLMLIRLNMRVTFNEFIRPICLPKPTTRSRSASRYAGVTAWVLGWGQTENSTSVCTPRMVSLEVYRWETCRTSITTLLCAGRPNINGYDACQGDSGGPLQIRNARNRFEVIGIVSIGVGCGEADYPGLYTDVARFVPWIHESTLGDSMYCWR